MPTVENNVHSSKSVNSQRQILESTQDTSILLPLFNIFFSLLKSLYQVFITR